MTNAVSAPVLLPVALPTPVLGLMAILLAVLWVGSHRFCRSLAARWRVPAFAGRSLLGAAVLAVTAEAAARGLTLATPWPLWAILGGGAILVETVVALYQLERRTLTRPVAVGLSLLRVALLLGLIAMLCQPVLVLDTSRRVRREVAVILDDTASMHVPDTGFSPSEKLRLAETLGVPAAHRSCVFETCAQRLRSLREPLQTQADFLMSLADAAPAVRAAQLGKRNAAMNRALHDALRDIGAESNACLSAATAATRMGDAPLRTLVNELDTKLRTEVCAPLKAALDASAADTPSADKATDKSAERADALLAAVRRAILQLDELAVKADAIAEKIDEDTYRALKAPEQAAIDEAAGVSRATLARTLLSHSPRTAGASPSPGLLQHLDDTYGVRFYVLGATPAPTRISSWLAEAARTNAPAEAAEPAARTDLASALEAVRADMQSTETAGVVLLSDGRHNTPAAVEPVARALGLQQTRVFPVVFGGARRPPADAAVAAANAPEAVSTNDKVSVEVDLKLDGLGGSNVVVQLFDGERFITSNAVVVAGDAVRRHVQLADTPRTNGLHQYRVVIPPLPSEVLTNNNVCVLPVTVGGDPTHLLLIEGRPRWEFRYLKNLFAGRDSTVHLQYVLFHPDRIADMPAPPDRTASVTNGDEDVQATALPATEAEWMKFDVIVLGDVSPEDLGPGALRALRAFVLDRGGSLVILAGALHMPHAYMGTPLADLLPVQCPSTDRPILTAPEAEFRFAPTAEGRESILMRLVDDPAQNAAAWDSIPPARWRHVLRTTKEGASVLAYALPSDPPEYLKLKRQEAVPDEETILRRRQFERENALIVVQHIAPGNVLFLASDNTWRLRYRRGDLFHHRFWGQVMRWATADRLAAGTLCARVGTDRPRYAVESPVRVRARLMAADYAPIRDAPVYATVWTGDRKLLRRHLPAQADLPGLYAADLGTFPEGRYRVELDVSEVQGLPDTGAVLTTEFAVTPDIMAERVELSADRGLLARVAALTGGQTLEPSGLQQVADLLGPAMVTRHERRQIELWDSAWFFALLVAVVSAEWILRKKERLP